MDSDRKHLTEVLRAAVAHRGSSLVEIYQNCPIFNDGAFDVLKDRDEASARLLHLRQGEPIVSGTQGVVRGDSGELEVVELASVDPSRLVVHDAQADNPAQQFAISRLDGASMAHVPVGIFRSVERPAYDDLVREQVAVARAGGAPSDDDLASLIAGKDTWTVSN
jgi:2-oxoglutarate ferredoxin oxidoreductase subunit beta